MEVVFSSDALREVKAASAYYEGEVEGLGKAFLGKLQDGVSAIRDFPYASRIIEGDYRRLLLSRFPHGIIYQIQGDTIFIAAVMHLKRRPGYWEKR